MKGDKAEVLEVRKKLAQACRILYMEGLADFNLGHVSGRGPDQEKIFMKPRGFGLEEIRPDDVIVVDLEGNLLEGAHSPHAETVIHTEIYKIRPEVQSAVHVHPVFTTAFSSVRLDIRPLNQDGVFFPRGVRTFESPELIRTKQQARALAEKLGEDNAVLIRNHGIATVGSTIEAACLTALFFERAIKVQLIASLFEEIEAIPDEIALKMYAAFDQYPTRNEEIWHYLTRKLEREGLALE